MNAPAIEAERISKAYKLAGRQPRADTLVSAIGQWLRRIGSNAAVTSPPDSAHVRAAQSHRQVQETFWALHEVSFTIQAGDVVGIIGRNGAGKSTLLKILSRVTRPTHGSVTLTGRVSSLLEVGTGFHPDLTGRENVYMSGAILGMTGRELDHRFQDIVDFSGVERFIDVPTKRYSSGMQVRLAFAVAAHLDPEILIIDEVLAVGDAKFQASCIQKMKETAQRGKTILFVTHNLGLTRQFCSTALLLDQGRLVFSGAPSHAIQIYQGFDESHRSRELDQRSDRHGAGAFKFIAATVSGSDSADVPSATGESFVLNLVVQRGESVSRTAGRLHIAGVIRDPFGTIITTLSTHFVNQGVDTSAPLIKATFVCERNPLLPGQYTLDVWCGDDAGDQDYIAEALRFDIADGCFFEQSSDLRLPNARLHGSLMIPFAVHVST
jgi:lipopolysaccharide transport system ATP-binding protein